MASPSELELVRRRLLGWSLAFEEVEPGRDIGRDLVLDGGLAASSKGSRTSPRRSRSR